MSETSGAQGGNGGGQPPEVVVVGEADFTGDDPVPAAASGTAPLAGATIGAELGGLVQRHRETTRRWLAGGLVALFGIVAVASLAAVIAGRSVNELKSLLEVLIPPIVALTGSALGFFFGVERGSG